MPPLSWQNALEDVGYVSDDRSPLYRSPCMEPWTKQIMPKTKEEANRFWKPIPFPKWQFHLNTSSPLNGLNGKQPGMPDQLAPFAATAAQIKPGIGGGVIFIDDSPVGSCSVISISSSSEEEENELCGEASDVKDMSMLSFQSNSLTSFSAQTPSPLTKDLELKKFVPSLPPQQKQKLHHQQQQQHQRVEMAVCTETTGGDTSHLTSSRPKRSRIVQLIPHDPVPLPPPQLEHNYIFSAPVPPSSCMMTGNSQREMSSESCTMRRESHLSHVLPSSNVHPSSRFPAHNCHYAAPGSSASSSNRRYYEHDVSVANPTNGSCCVDPFAPPSAADQSASGCGRCCNPPIIERPRHARSSHYLPFPMQTSTQDFLPPSATIVHVPQSQLPPAPQIPPHNSGACGTSNYTSFTYFSK